MFVTGADDHRGAARQAVYCDDRVAHPLVVGEQE
jgi:hypothetical protein